MHTAMLLEMAADAGGDRIGVGPLDGGWTYGDLLIGARRVAARLRRSGAAHATLVDLNSDAVPLLLFGSALAGLPFAPVNYRLADDQLRAILGRLAPALVVVDPEVVERVQRHRRRRGRRPRRVPRRARRRGRRARPTTDGHRPRGHRRPAVHERHHRRAQGRGAAPPAPHLLHLRDGRVHGRRRGRGQLVSVPPYHIAGISAVLSARLRRPAHRATCRPSTPTPG